MLLRGKTRPSGCGVQCAGGLFPAPSRCTWRPLECSEHGQPAALGTGEVPHCWFLKKDSRQFTEAVPFLLGSKNSAQT